MRDECSGGEVVRAGIRVDLGRRGGVSREGVAGEVGGGRESGRELVGRDVGERKDGAGRAGRTGSGGGGGWEDGVVCGRDVEVSGAIPASSAE